MAKNDHIFAHTYSDTTAWPEAEAVGKCLVLNMFAAQVAHHNACADIGVHYGDKYSSLVEVGAQTWRVGL